MEEWWLGRDGDGSVRSDVVVASLFFFFNDTATTEIYTLSLHDALPISKNVRVLVQEEPRHRSPGELLEATSVCLQRLRI